MRGRAWGGLLALAVAGLASPAHADEAYAEVIGGISFGPEEDAAIFGLAAGYDWDLTETIFVGLEASLDKEMVKERHVALGIGVRAGLEVTERGKAFVGLNYQSKDCPHCEAAWGFSGGWEQEIGERLYLKGEYKHLATEHEGDKEILIAGLGIMF
ncbi:hypothetical protein [Novosphingobium sp. MBES04]|uniref:hypothetical protein n=1 Tax=Novosphingobium sp. MBES04 TaxID=1206458 RepID=UPI00057E55AE|nr:hypothetical protein [Novosphingobium sp. MBES04]GAM07156.1 hypothetical conserved protein [Novosphingobium sp. MBES04]